ncbi:MAG: dethiobiotin synthase [Thermoleophilaceae bacterium]
MRGIFVTGTGTGVGKSVVAAAVCASLSAAGERVAAFKPVVTGLDEPGEWPPDHELLASAANAGQKPNDVAPYRFGAAFSPHLAAEVAGETIAASSLVEHARAAAEGADALVCEGVGGLLVPLTPDYLVRDLAVGLGLPLVVAASPGLGTINHTLLTIEAGRATGLTVAGVVMTPWPDEAGELERSNADTVARLGAVEVAQLPRCEPGTLAEAGDELPLARWLAARHN